MERQEAAAKRLRKRAHRISNAVTILLLALCLDVFAWLPAYLIVSFQASAGKYDPMWVAWFFITSGIALLLMFVRTIVNFGGSASWRKEVRLATETHDRLLKLLATEPGTVAHTVAQADYNDAVEAENASKEGQKSFWSQIWFGLIFTLFGFALSYTATKLGWLR